MAKKGLGVELSTIVITAFAFFLWASIFTYHSQDPSLFTQSTEVVLNSCGQVGASLAAIALQFFGLGSFLIPVGFLFVAARVHHHDGIARALSSLAGLSLSVISLTVFMSLHWKIWHWSGTQFLTGGLFGTWLSAPLEHFLNRTGASIVSLAIFTSTLVISTPIGVANFLSKLIHASGVLIYRFSRLAATYFAYYSAILLNKLAQFIGIQARRSFDQIRERADAYRLAKSQAQTALVHEVTESEDESDVADMKVKSKKKLESEAQLVKRTTKNAPSGATSANEDEEDEIPLLPAKVGKQTELNEESETSVISVADLRKAARKKPDSIEAGPVIEKAVAVVDSDASKPKFKFDMKRGKWKLPVIDFLRKATKIETAIDRDRLTQRAGILSDKLAEFGIDGEVTAMRVGPVITLYEFKPGPGIKVSRISGLIEDLSMALASKSVRILAPLPGKAVVGIEIPSENREQVLLREFLQTGEFQNPKYQIPVVMGKDIAGQSIFADLAKMPHLLVSGQTGSGKSVFMNGLICSLLYRFTPDELRLILVDPKFIEFSFYHDIPHLLLPVVDDPKNASSALKWAVREMERRYRILEAAGVRNLQSYNEKVDEMGAEAMALLLQTEAQVQEESGNLMTGGDWIEVFEKDDSGAPIIGKLPYTVIIIDELADLMMTVKKEVEGSIARIAQKARASGIHLVLATQRPSTDVVTGLIKANMPTRLSFSLSSQIDSRTILDRAGAERLLGQGDMLFIPPGQNEPVRLQGAFIDDNELTKITDFLREQGKPAYRNEILIDPEEQSADGSGESESDQDPLFEEALYIVRNSRSASASFLQRRLQIGYNRAARIIELMESRGIVGPADGAKPREILMP
ncbi:MAG: DNA translocase FtsK 4TM domain-containing protein [Bdellovibrionales bacterium]|nr:DNA translocase FtsK 4TM domain-containing protein [Oligoflexia bacterium]